ncbi:MAG: hypothetical protein PW843_03585 [Azospirillaceae bacterium]|nr:hypothetical protein [Azospirillaceae bacterium]
MTGLPPPDGSPSAGPRAGLTRQHRTLLFILGLAMIGGRLWDMHQSGGHGQAADWIVMALGAGVLGFVLIISRRPGR